MQHVERGGVSACSVDYDYDNDNDNDWTGRNTRATHAQTHRQAHADYRRRPRDRGGDREFVSDTPLRRFGTPTEVAAVALLLASDETAYVTGRRWRSPNRPARPSPNRASVPGSGTGKLAGGACIFVENR